MVAKGTGKQRVTWTKNIDLGGTIETEGTEKGTERDHLINQEAAEIDMRDHPEGVRVAAIIPAPGISL